VFLHISTDAVSWALKQLKALPRDQILLLFLICVELSNHLTNTRLGTQPTGFLAQLNRFLGVEIEPRKTRIYSVLEGKWRAEAYLQSTVIGRLLNGSHIWTSPTDGFLVRTPKAGWPAELAIAPSTISALKSNKRPPKLSHSQLPPIQALAILYFRYQDLPVWVQGIHDVVDLFQQRLSGESDLISEITRGDITFLGQAVVNTKPEPEEILSCYPPLYSSKIILSEETSRIAMEKAPPGIEPTEYVELLVRNAR